MTEVSSKRGLSQKCLVWGSPDLFDCYVVLTEVFFLKEASVKTAWCGVHPTYLTAWGEMTTTIGKLLGQKMVDEIDCFVP